MKTNESSNFEEDAVHICKCWAAIRNNNVVSIISMKVPSDVDFENFRKKAIETLSFLGDVKTGDLYENDGFEFFLPRPHKHQNRNKKKKTEIKPIKLYKKYSENKDEQ